MKQTAWLSAVPDGEDEGRSRLEIMQEEGGAVPPLPDNPAPYLTDWLFEIGPTSGDGVLTWTDLAAWQSLSGIVLRPLKATILRRLSSEFANERYRARKTDRQMPFDLNREDIAARRETVAAKVERIFG